MLKITLNPRIGPNGSQVFAFDSDWIVCKDTETNTVSEFSKKHSISDQHRYTPEQRDIIYRVNSILEENLLRSMTDEEIEYLLYPLGKVDKTTTEEYQKLAGFSVHKEVKYEGDHDE
jgi:hypothetical protein